MSIISEISQALMRDPKINRVTLTEREMELLRVELWDYDPRTALLSKEARLVAFNELRFSKIMIMGRPVEARR